MILFCSEAENDMEYNMAQIRLTSRVSHLLQCVFNDKPDVALCVCKKRTINYGYFTDVMKNTYSETF